MNLFDNDRLDMFLESSESGEIIDLSEMDWYSIAGFFKDIPLVGGFAKDYRLGYNMAEKGPIAATLLLAAMVALGYKVYKNHFSKAAKACKQHKGQTRKSCVKAYRDQALKLEIQAYQKMTKKCKMSQDPDKCVTGAKKKIDKLRSRLSTGGVNENFSLKSFAAHYVDLHDIDTETKIEMLGFIKGCNELQLEHFLLTGGIMTDDPETLSEGPMDWAAKKFIGAVNKAGETGAAVGNVDVSQIEAMKKMKDMMDAAQDIPGQAPEIAESAYIKMLAIIATVGMYIKKQVGRIADPGMFAKAGMSHGMQTGGIILGGTVLAALIATGAFKVYKSYLSKAAQACSKHSKTEKQTCIKQYTLQNKTKYMQLLQKGKDSCKYSRDPAKCTFKIDKKINKIKLELSTLHKG